MKTRFHIAFEGPIAAVKTTLARLLAANLGAELVLEAVEENEFLADFYNDRERWSLSMQLWFLAARHQQLSSFPRPGTTFAVADYTYLKDGIFARFLLKGRELRLYNRIASGLASELARPDLIVFLDAPNDVLIERIRQRKRKYEMSIDANYLDALRVAYERDLVSVEGLNILRCDTSRMNLASEAELTNFYQSILAKLPD